MENNPSIFISGMSQVALMGKQTLSGGSGGWFESQNSLAGAEAGPPPWVEETSRGVVQGLGQACKSPNQFCLEKRSGHQRPQETH